MVPLHTYTKSFRLLIFVHLIFLCENNQYGMSMSTRRAMRNETVAQRVNSSMGTGYWPSMLPSQPRCSARDGHGPSLIESRTYRYRGHAKSDQNLYRSRDEIREWQQRDPIQYLLFLENPYLLL
jgi:acetoin:2,6-dichlorophenolindophenol oxidoreductase subunit alpha